MSDGKLKLFVWEGDGVLTDWTNGMICAVAEDLESALKAIEAECSYCMNAFPPHPTHIVELPVKEPRAWVCWGGG